MKRFLLAAAIAIGATLSMPVIETSAASVTINDNGITVRDGRQHNYRNYRRHFRERSYSRRHSYRQRCRVRTVKIYKHHRVTIRKVRVCR